jgi:predicted DNA-binding WGR domain protein
MGKTSAVCALCFQRIRPERNEWRHYTIEWGLDLFGSHTIVLSWGRIGCARPRRKALSFPSEEDLLAELARQIARRLRRGYRLTWPGDELGKQLPGTGPEVAAGRCRPTPQELAMHLEQQR